MACREVIGCTGDPIAREGLASAAAPQPGSLEVCGRAEAPGRCSRQRGSRNRGTSTIRRAMHSGWIQGVRIVCESGINKMPLMMPLTRCRAPGLVFTSVRLRAREPCVMAGTVRAGERRGRRAGERATARSPQRAERRVCDRRARGSRRCERYPEIRTWFIHVNVGFSEQAPVSASRFATREFTHYECIVLS